MKIEAKAQRNGNTEGHFADAYKAIMDAQRAINEARATMMCNILHGRNYQHLQDGDALCISNRREADEKFMLASRTMGLLASDILDTLDL